ncbi:hypothetical protein PENTCL1PPCAC_23890, partial [Pristionchus entomophagus]
ARISMKVIPFFRRSDFSTMNRVIILITLIVLSGVQADPQPCEWIGKELGPQCGGYKECPEGKKQFQVTKTAEDAEMFGEDFGE